MGSSLAEKHLITAPLVHGRKWELALSLAQVRMTTSLGEVTEPCISLYHHVVFAITPLSSVLPHPFSVLPLFPALCCLTE